jgi:hypothetical protein
MSTQDNIDKAFKLYKSCSSKLTNMLPWTQPIPDRISIAIDLLKQSILDYKIQKDTANQIKYSFLLDTYYDEHYKHTYDKLNKSSQALNLKELIHICEKDNKQQILNNTDPKYDIFELTKKYIYVSEETGEEYNIISCYKFVIEYYSEPKTDKQVELIFELYEKMKGIKTCYEEKYGDLLVTEKEDYKTAAEIYEKIAKYRIDKPTKFSCDTLLMKAFMCYLFVDEISAEIKLNEFEITYPIITNTTKFKLCKNIMNEYINKDVDAYILNIRDYDDISRLDDFMVNLLNKIKKNMSTEEVDLC